jgi:hypothetical protein
MNREAIAELEARASNPSAGLEERIAAVEEMGRDETGRVCLKTLLGRPVDVSEHVMNWDPAGAQRVVKLHAIAALHALGNDSELRRIAALVCAAGRVLQGPDDERRHAAAVIANIGSTTVIGDLVGALGSPTGPAAANVIQVLDSLKLPKAPTRQSLGGIAGIRAEVTGVSMSFQDLLKLVTTAARGWVRTSPGVAKMLLGGAAPMGRTELRKAKVSFLLEHFLSSLKLDYYVAGGKAVICTFIEAAERWQNWWTQYKGLLGYSREKRAFLLEPGYLAAPK